MALSYTIMKRVIRASTFASELTKRKQLGWLGRGSRARTEIDHSRIQLLKIPSGGTSLNKNCSGKSTCVPHDSGHTAPLVTARSQFEACAVQHLRSEVALGVLSPSSRKLVGVVEDSHKLPKPETSECSNMTRVSSSILFQRMLGVETTAQVFKAEVRLTFEWQVQPLVRC